MTDWSPLQFGQSDHHHLCLKSLHNTIKRIISLLQVVWGWCHPKNHNKISLPTRAYHHYIRNPYPKQGSSQLPQNLFQIEYKPESNNVKRSPNLKAAKPNSNNARASRTWSLQARFTQIQTAQQVPELDICKPDSNNTRGSLVQLMSDWQPKPSCLIRPPQLSQNCSRTAFTSNRASIAQTTHFD
jgi:hypothetical protein